jgi:putative membrane protein
MIKSNSKAVPQSSHPLVTGVVAGLLAGAAAGQSDRLLDRFVSKEQKKRDRKVRKAPAHEMAGPYFARKISGKRLSKKQEQRAKQGFGLAYGILWGLIYAAARKKAPRLARWGGIPFGIPFFLACDGTMAPLLGVSPSLRKIPWQPSAKELGNHLAWTVAAETVHRLAARYVSKSPRRRR